MIFDDNERVHPYCGFGIHPEHGLIEQVKLIPDILAMHVLFCFSARLIVLRVRVA